MLYYLLNYTKGRTPAPTNVVYGEVNVLNLTKGRLHESNLGLHLLNYTTGKKII